MAEDSVGAPRAASSVNIECRKIVERAKRGNPVAFRKILAKLEASLRGEGDLDFVVSRYCADALKQLLENTKAWHGTEEEFRRLGHSADYRFSRRGPRLSEATLKRIGIAFCRAFGLSKPQGKDAEYHRLLLPRRVEKVLDLRLCGATFERAIEIVRSDPGTDLSERQIKEWFRRCESLRLPKPMVGEFLERQYQWRRKLARLVRLRMKKGASLPKACKEAASIAVAKLHSLPGATVPLEVKTVRAAYDYIEEHRAHSRAVQRT